MIPKPRTVRLKGKAYAKFRLDVAERAMGRCEVCKCYCPPYDSAGNIDPWYCGQVAHIKSRGAGGGDTMDNVQWKCRYCHLVEEHTKGKK